MTHTKYKTDLNRAYVPYYADLLKPAPRRVGFRWDVVSIKKSNYASILADIKASRFVSIDTETAPRDSEHSALEWDTCELISFSLSLPGNRNFVGFYYRGYFSAAAQELLPLDGVLDAIIDAALSVPVCFMYNRGFDQRVLMWTRGFAAKRFWRCVDVLDLVWLLDTNVKSGIGLKKMAATYLGLDMVSFEDTAGVDIKKADPKTLAYYGAGDSYATLELGQLVYTIFRDRYQMVMRIRQAELNALFDFEEQPQTISLDAVRALEASVVKELDEVKSKFYAEYGVINLASSQQRSAILFRLGYNTGEMLEPDKDGTPVMSTAGKLLERLANMKSGCPAAELMLQYNKLSKLLSSYVKPLLDFLEDGLVARTHYPTRSAPTCRLACSARTIGYKKYLYSLPLNLQSMPKPAVGHRGLDFDPVTWNISWRDSGEYWVETGLPERNFRAVFSNPNDGGIYVKADYSQQELLIAAALSSEPAWLPVFQQRGDIHAASASVMYPGAEIDFKKRRAGKVGNLSLLYIGGPRAIQKATGFPLTECQDFVSRYEAGLPTLYKWKEDVIAAGRRDGYIRNMYGFERRVFRYFHSNSPADFAHGEKTCISQSIQGLAAWFLAIVLAGLHNMLYRGGGKWHGTGITFVVTIHDEIDCYIPKAMLPKAAEFIHDFKQLMEGVSPKEWPFSLWVDVEVGDSLGTMFKVEPQYKDGESIPWAWLPVSDERPKPKEAEPVPGTLDPETGRRFFRDDLDIIYGVEEEIEIDDSVFDDDAFDY